jgi:hypothetical protein
MNTSAKDLEVKIGTAVEEVIANIYVQLLNLRFPQCNFRQYKLPGEFNPFDREITATNKLSGDTCTSFLEIKNRSCNADTYSDTICPIQKREAAKKQDKPVLLLTVFKDGAMWLTDIKNAETMGPPRIFDRYDKVARGDTDNRLHDVFDLKVSTKFL